MSIDPASRRTHSRRCYSNFVLLHFFTFLVAEMGHVVLKPKPSVRHKEGRVGIPVLDFYLPTKRYLVCAAVSYWDGYLRRASYGRVDKVWTAYGIKSGEKHTFIHVVCRFHSIEFLIQR